METKITVLLPSESELSSPKSSPPSSPKSSPSSSSSSSPNDSRKKYDVFLNFRGEDTRKTFLGHLRAALSYSKGIETFVDDDQIESGKYISSQLLEAIEDSTCSIIIFSENYASSTWCLDELVKILDCMKNKGQVVLPVFYHVDPSDVRKQTGTFGVAFAKHEENLREDLERVESWRNALTKITGVAGLDLRNYRDEADFIRVIVEEVSRKLSTPLSSPQKDNHSFLAKLYSCGSATFSVVIIFLVFFLVFAPLFGLFFFKILVPLFEKILGFGNTSHNYTKVYK
ncbi:hypothetical protein UlMin_037517 [Ulmus minor]